MGMIRCRRVGIVDMGMGTGMGDTNMCRSRLDTDMVGMVVQVMIRGWSGRGSGRGIVIRGIDGGMLKAE